MNLKAEVESSISHFSFNTLSSRRFQLRFDRVNLHRLTQALTACSQRSPPSPEAAGAEDRAASEWNSSHSPHVYPRASSVEQGLTLVRYSAQLEPFLTQKHTLNTPNTPATTPNCTPVTQKALKLS